MLLRTAVIYVGVVLTCTLVLTSLLIFRNEGPFGALAVAELLAATLAISLVTHAGFLALLAAGWPVAVRLAPKWFRGRWPSYSLAGLVALDLAWVLWNRLTMVHQWASVRPFITWSGIVQSFFLIVIAVAVVIAGVRFGRRRTGTVQGAVAAVLAVALAITALAWNRHDERFHRRYPPQSFKAAAGEANADVTREGAGPVILVGIDGLCWSVALPLLKTGRLPTLAALIRRGASGYLDNGNESLSPSVWTTIYTGRPSTVHDIEGYERMVLPRSGRSLTKLLLMKPSIESAYGLRYLLTYLEWLGLWDLDFVGPADRRAPAAWEVVSYFGQRVVVANALLNVPVQRIDGAMVALYNEPSEASMYPPALTEMWHPYLPEDPTGQTDASLVEMGRALRNEVTFTLNLVEAFEPSLTIYYTHFVDSVTHHNWDFYARDDFLLTDLPRSREDKEWERFLTERLDDRLLRAYTTMDEQLARFVNAYPGATFLVVSDHGWSFSGAEHFGSPDGVLILSGPGVRRGVTAAGSTLDVLPTVLALLGVPISRELEGRIMNEILDPVPEPVYVTRYGKEIMTAARGGQGRTELGTREIERLRALGYVQ